MSLTCVGTLPCLHAALSKALHNQDTLHIRIPQVDVWSLGQILVDVSCVALYTESGGTCAGPPPLAPRSPPSPMFRISLLILFWSGGKSSDRVKQ